MRLKRLSTLNGFGFGEGSEEVLDMIGIGEVLRNPGVGGNEVRVCLSPIK